jgi:HEAT repeat protein
MRFKTVLCSFYVLGGLWVLPAQPNVTAWNVLTTAAYNAKNPDHRKQAVAALGAIGPAPDAVKVLEDVLRKDADSGVRQTAAAALWDLGDPAGKLTFEEIIARERKLSKGLVGGKMDEAKQTMHDPGKLAYMGVKEAAGALLGPFSMGIPVAHEIMKDVTKDPGATGRALAAEYMSKDCDARAVQMLEWSLKEDGNWLVKAASARALGKCGDTQAIPVLEGYLKDSHEPLKYQAAAAIVRLSLKQTAPVAAAANDKP